MQKLKIMFAATCLFFLGSMHAQVQVTTTTSTLPDWGVAGADDARYYYLPDMEAFYDIRGRNFIYMNNGQWEKTSDVPPMYRDVDLYDSYKVVLNEDREPFEDIEKLKVKYAKGYRGDPQKTVKIKQRKDGTLKIKEKSK
jgi:hypothetical protein